MERQAGFLLALLFLANFLTIGADGADPIQYIGFSNALAGNSGWTITCMNLQPSDVVEWTRDGASIRKEIDDKEIILTTSSSESTINSTLAQRKHDGIYKCTKNSTFGHKLTVHGESKSDDVGKTVPPPSTEVLKSSPSNQIVDIYPFTKQNLTISCNVTSGSSFTWTHNNATLKETNSLKLQNGGRELFISKPSDENMGNYTCSADGKNLSQIMRVVPYPIVKLPAHDTNVVEGEKLQLTCDVTEGLGAEITWIFDNNTYTTGEDRINITVNEKSSTLTVYDIRQEDRGDVVCKVVFTRTNDHFVSNYTTLLRVTNKFAALWPFLGICAEVIVLCAIILVYEKKRNKAELEESDTDQSPDTNRKRTSPQEEYYIPLQGPLPPSELPVEPPITPPTNPTAYDHKAVHFQNTSSRDQQRGNLSLRSAPPALPLPTLA